MTFKLLTSAAVALGLSAAASHAVPSLSFIIDGDTFSQPFSFTNTSDSGELLTAFGFVLPSGFCIDADMINPGCNQSAGGAFMPVPPSAADTGLTSSSAPDTGDTVTLTFNDFDPGETFSFDLDIDQASGLGSATVTGDELIGATAFADFSDGQRVLGTFMAIAGNSDASGFVATGIIQTPAIPLPAGLPIMLTAVGAFAYMRKRKG